MHDPVFGEPTQYGTPYHAFCNAVLTKEIAGERKSAYADRAVRGFGAALDHVLDPGLPPTASAFDDATCAVSRSNHRDFFWPPILKTFLILRDLGVDGAEDFAGRISGVDIEASFAQRPPSNWAPSGSRESGSGCAKASLRSRKRAWIYGWTGSSKPTS
jgi:hypothetical protein